MAWHAAPAGKRRRGPKRSAIGPNNGDNKPPRQAPTVIAAAINARLQPKSSLIGLSTTAMVILLTPAAKKPATIVIATISHP